jgi:hypothetical protein
LPSASQNTLPLTFDISTMAARIQVPKLKVSPTGATNVTAWRNNLIPLVRSSGIAAHLDGEVKPPSQEQADREKYAKNQASAVLTIISNVEDTTLHSALVDMTVKSFNQLPHDLYKALVLYATKDSGTAHDLLLDEQRDAMFESNEPLLIYLARHFAILAQLVEASAPNTSISNTIKAIVQGLSCSGQHAFAYMQISLKTPTSMTESSEIFTTLQPSVESLARHT